LMQNFKSHRYRGKRVRFSAVVKSENISSWAGLWMRVDGDKGEILRFDNMEKRSIKGTTDWGRHHVVLDVPEESTGIFFGILLDGTGQVWLSGVQFEEAPNEPTTDSVERDEPGNLDFSET
jgi:AraC family transcriptional regulator